MKNVLIISIVLLSLVLGGLLIMLVLRQNARVSTGDSVPGVRVTETTTPEQRETVVMPTQDPNQKPEGQVMPENEALRKLQNERLAM